MKEAIIQALREFDPLDDDQWTADGAPKMEVVHRLAEDDKITRKDVVEAAPDFNRETAADPDNLLMNKEETDAQEGETPSEASSETPSEVTNDEEQPNDDDEDEEPPVVEDEEQPTEPVDVAEIEMTQENINRAIADADVEDLQEIHDHLRQMEREETKISDQHKKRADIARIGAKVAMNRLRSLEPTMTNDQNIRAYIDSQNAQRAAGRAAVLKSLKPEELDPRSPLDRAMARKTARGTQRPVRSSTG